MNPNRLDMRNLSDIGVVTLTFGRSNLPTIVIPALIHKVLSKSTRPSVSIDILASVTLIGGINRRQTVGKINQLFLSFIPKLVHPFLRRIIIP
mmetsp:Transcript_29737/g.44878  ORF Transcript_29737/g.44878 Transcript_29737/m.44878 type:complete len:93 (-) Transcript_29737:535-813(-)